MTKFFRNTLLLSLVSAVVISFISTEVIAAGALKIKSGDEAVAIVKKLVGKKAARYKYELNEDNQVIPDGKGNFAASREDGKVSNGIDCYVVRVFTETTAGDSVSQENFAWFFVAKSTGKVYKMTDPFQEKLKVVK